MTRKGIIKEVAERTGANLTVTGFVVEETIKVIAESLCRGEAVYLRGLFSLTPVVRKKKLARNITDVLEFTHLAKLPKKVDPESFIWIEGIAKIRLVDNSFGYGVVKRNPDLTYRISYINGATSPILHVEEVYPTIVIDKSHIKKFHNKEDRDGRIAYLQGLHLPYEIDFESADIDTLNKEIVKAAIFQQLNALEE